MKKQAAGKPNKPAPEVMASMRKQPQPMNLGGKGASKKSKSI